MNQEEIKMENYEWIIVLCTTAKKKMGENVRAMGEGNSDGSAWLWMITHEAKKVK